MYRQPDFLGGSHHPKHRLRCPVHGFIRFSDVERKIIDHWLFRRLRFVRQLALTELIYPGACHTRFEHSLGAMEMATRMFDRLASVEGALMEKVFTEVDALKERPLAKARQILPAGSVAARHGAQLLSRQNSYSEDVVLHEGAWSADELRF